VLTLLTLNADKKAADGMAYISDVCGPHQFDRLNAHKFKVKFQLYRRIEIIASSPSSSLRTPRG